MKPLPLAIQLYSLREEAKADLFGTLKKVASFGYQGVEFAGLHGHQPREIRKVMDDLGLVTPAVHGPMPTPENLSEILDVAAALGLKWQVSGMGRKDLEAPDFAVTMGARFALACKTLNKSGIAFGVHNHEFEFDRSVNGKLLYDRLMEAAPEAVCEIDTYWVAVAGANVPAIIRQYAKRLRLLHIKDGPLDRDKAMTAVGKGRMDWKPVFAAAEKSDAEWLVVELDRCDTDMSVAVRESAEFLIGEGYAKSGTIS